MIRSLFYIILVLFLLRALRSLWSGIVEGLNQPEHHARNAVRDSVRFHVEIRS